MPPAAEALPAKYKPADHESVVRSRWDASGAFHADPDRVLSGEREAYSIFIPPPNVTARLHLGHALNNTLQDILARVHRMRGFEVLWMPGTDHAGIATQAVVENRLRTEGKIKGPLRESMPREEFVAQVQAWKDEYEKVITDQLKTIGCSCDWARQRFTMDEVCARAVREAFFILFRDGLIYRGKRLVNWDPATQTALADDEVEMEEVDGFFYYLRYPLVDLAGKPVTWATLAQRGYPGAASQPQDQGAWVTVATTRPETYLGDTAVGVNPKDPRAAALRGLRCALPIVGRVIPIVEDDYVVMPAADPSAEGVDPKAKFATGFLKVTPAHDPNDYELGRRHSLDIINVMAPDASISDEHGWNDIGGASMFLGLTREKARERVLEEFKKLGLLEKVTPYRHSVGHSYRSHVPIEPYLSDQWYCRVTDDRMRGSALRAMAEGQRSAASSSLPLLGGMGVPAGRVSRAPGRKEEAIEGVGTGVTPIPPRGGRKDNADPAGDGGLTFFPDRYARMYESWHENLRDWCISRQLWWGHRIPVWSATFPDAGVREAAEGDGVAIRHTTHGTETTVFICLREDDPAAIRKYESAGYSRDPDVLDTWFSSALWPMSTLGWPEPKGEMKGLLEVFNPSAVLATAREIITLWVSRMVMFNRYFLSRSLPLLGGTDWQSVSPPSTDFTPGRVPFRHVYINPVVQDGHGQRMSKSLGNGVDPLDIVHSHGTDALRYLLCQITTGTQDVRLGVDLSCPHCQHAFEPVWITSPAGYKVAAPNQTCPACKKKMVTAYGVAIGTSKPTSEAPLARNSSTRFDVGRNFCTKLWNAARFAMMNLEGDSAAPIPSEQSRLTLPDRWMLSRLVRTVQQVNEALAEYQFSRYSELMYDLFWRDFCDWYLEAIKPSVKSNMSQQAVLRHTLDAVLRLLHPITPFITEVLYGALRPASRPAVPGLTLRDHERLCLAGWPEVDAALVDETAEREFARLQALVDQIRQVRSAKGVEPRRKVTLHADAQTAADAASWGGLVESLAGLEKIVTQPGGPLDAPFLFEGRACALSNLMDVADADDERSRLTEALAKLDKDISVIEARLNNPGYSAKAPPHLVEETRQSLAKKHAERDATRSRLATIGP